jgi:hypothetical protein
MAQFANPSDVKNLSDWVARFGKYKNVILDPATGEPVVLEAKKDNPAVVLRIPWKREGDAMVVLTNPSRFSAASVAAAAQRYKDATVPEHEDVSVETLRSIEGRLLEAWRLYRAEPSRPRMKDVNSIEKELLAAELAQSRPDRGVLEGRYMVPILPIDRRSIGVADVGVARTSATATATASATATATDRE